MLDIEVQYLNLLEDVIANGIPSEDRTGTGTLSVFGRQIRADLSKGFPLLTTKKVSFKNVALELLFFLGGHTNNNWLKDRGCNIWTPWEGPDGSLGRVYGAQWTSWYGWKEKPDDMYLKLHNQVADLIDEAKVNPTSRRLLVSAWNVAELDQMVLPPCHYSWQVYIRNGKLSLLFNMRSSDVGIGLPYNISSYALLYHMLAHVLGYEPGELVGNLGDTHVYKDHLPMIIEQLKREPCPLPNLVIKRKVENIFDFNLDDFEIQNYQHHAPIKMPISV